LPIFSLKNKYPPKKGKENNKSEITNILQKDNTQIKHKCTNMGCKRKQLGPPKGGQNSNLGPRKPSSVA
jgi:hypothetical protein